MTQYSAVVLGIGSVPNAASREVTVCRDPTTGGRAEDLSPRLCNIHTTQRRGYGTFVVRARSILLAAPGGTASFLFRLGPTFACTWLNELPQARSARRRSQAARGMHQSSLSLLVLVHEAHQNRRTVARHSSTSCPHIISPDAVPWQGPDHSRRSWLQ